MSQKQKSLVNWILLLLLVAAVLVAAWFRVGPSGEVAVVRYPKNVMGTVCTLACVVQQGDEAKAEKVLQEAEKEIRRLEGIFSSWLTHSEVSQLNAAEAGEVVPLSPETLAVLIAARTAHNQTEGAFDVTCRPLVALWKKAGEEGRFPTEEAIHNARAASTWESFALGPTGMTKKSPTASVDLGGIAKGTVIDRALKIIQKGGFLGGLVDIGGDLRCFGTQPGGKPFEATVNNPFSEDKINFPLRNQAVCTSGDYARYIEVDGKRYSHIVDPRTGKPLQESPSVTVVAPTAEQADVWATALSILGPEGFKRLLENVHALIIHPDGNVIRTKGFVKEDKKAKEEARKSSNRKTSQK